MSSKPSKPRFGDALQRRLGFKTRYDFLLWSFFGGALAVFSLMRMKYMHPPTYARETQAGGEWYWFRQQPYKFGLFLHLRTIIPAALLCLTQFVPRIRTTSMLVHRVVGYMVVGLVVTSTLGSLIIARRTFGGDLATQSGVAVLAIMTDTALALAWWNARKHQIDQHRKWMIRAMVWMSQIITLRISLFAGVLIVSWIGGYASIYTCDEAIFVAQNASAVFSEFPQCRALGRDTRIVVPMGIDTSLHFGSAFRGMFATATWVATAVHVAAVEVYLALTSAESERLRIQSYHRQRAAGLANPGSAGITNDRWGDAPLWQPPAKVTE